MAYTSVTLAELDKRLVERLDQHPYYTVQDRYDALRMVLKIWQAATGVWRGEVTATAIVGDPYVPVPGLVQVTGVRWGGVPLSPTTIHELDATQPNWRLEVAGAGGRPATPKYWAPIGLTAVALWPTPAATTAITCQGLVLPPAPAPGAQLVTIDVADFWVDTLADLAAWWVTGKAMPAEQDKFQPHFAAALQMLARVRGTSEASSPFQALLEALVGKTARPTGRDLSASSPNPAEGAS
jgi:hypothetical protein